MYAYDTLDRLILEVTPQGAVATAVYDAANEQMQFGSATLTYDANGNLTNDGTNSYAWDARNRLVGISGGVTASFQYDGLGRRVSKTIDGVTTQYLYDGNDIVQEFNGGAVGASYLRSLNIDEPFVRQAGTGEFYHADALGSSLVLSNTNGMTTTTCSYEPFGNATMAGTSSNPFQFTGRENDQTGLYYYRTRYYNPDLQRFIREDSIGIVGGLNLYAYVGNDPGNQTDPLGLYGLAGAGGATVTSAALQFFGNLVQTGGDIGRSLRCINLTNVAVSGVLGFLGPTLGQQIIRGIPGPFSVPRYAEAIIFFETVTPLGYLTKVALPDYSLGNLLRSLPLPDYLNGNKCECQGLSWGNLASQLIQ